MKRTDQLLYQMIPKKIADRLRSGEKATNLCEVGQHITFRLHWYSCPINGRSWNCQRHVSTTVRIIEYERTSDCSTRSVFKTKMPVKRTGIIEYRDITSFSPACNLCQCLHWSHPLVGFFLLLLSWKTFGPWRTADYLWLSSFEFLSRISSRHLIAVQYYSVMWLVLLLCVLL